MTDEHVRSTQAVEDCRSVTVTVTRSEAPAPATSWMNPEDILLDERKPGPKGHVVDGQLYELSGESDSKTQEVNQQLAGAGGRRGEGSDR